MIVAGCLALRPVEIDLNVRRLSQHSALSASPQVELLQLGKSGIRVATYLTELPSKAVLERKLHAAAQSARNRLTGRAG